MLESFAFYLSFVMAVFLFLRGYIEAIKISNADDRVYGGTLILCVIFALFFSKMSFVFY